MTIFISNTADLTATINAIIGSAFIDTDFVFGVPRSTTPTELANYGKNSAVTVTPSKTGATKITGTATILYNRLRLKPLEAFNLLNCQIADNVSMPVWLPLTKEFLGIPFLPSDFVDHLSILTGNKVTVTLEAKPESLGWLGSATLNFSAYPDISTAFATNLLTGF